MFPVEQENHEKSHFRNLEIERPVREMFRKAEDGVFSHIERGRFLFAPLLFGPADGF